MVYTILENFQPFHQIWNCRLQALSVWKSKIFVVWEKFQKNIVQSFGQGNSREAWKGELAILV